MVESVLLAHICANDTIHQRGDTHKHASTCIHHKTHKHKRDIRAQWHILLHCPISHHITFNRLALLCAIQHKAVTLLDLVHVLLRVLVGHVGWTDVQLEVGPEVLKVIVVGQFWKNKDDGSVYKHK